MTDDGPHRQAVALGLVVQIDRSKLSSAKDLYELAFEPNDMGISFGLAVYGLYYNTKAFADNKWPPPTSWMDLFRPELKGKITVHNIGNANGLYLLLALNRIAGGTEANVDAGFAKVKELAPSVVTFDTFGETPTLIQQGRQSSGPGTSMGGEPRRHRGAGPVRVSEGSRLGSEGRDHPGEGAPEPGSRPQVRGHDQGIGELDVGRFLRQGAARARQRDDDGHHSGGDEPRDTAPHRRRPPCQGEGAVRTGVWRDATDAGAGWRPTR
jgi:hypothetical protein